MMMKKIIATVRAALWHTPCSTSKFNRPAINVSTSTPKAPTAPASLGGDDIVERIILNAELDSWGLLILIMTVTFFLGFFLDWILIYLGAKPLRYNSEEPNGGVRNEVCRLIAIRIRNQ